MPSLYGSFFYISKFDQTCQKFSKGKNKRINAVNWRTSLKSDSRLTKKSCFKNDEKSFLFHLESSFHSKDI